MKTHELASVLSWAISQDERRPEASAINELRQSTPDLVRAFVDRLRQTRHPEWAERLSVGQKERLRWLTEEIRLLRREAEDPTPITELETALQAGTRSTAEQAAIEGELAHGTSRHDIR